MMMDMVLKANRLRLFGREGEDESGTDGGSGDNPPAPPSTDPPNPPTPPNDNPDMFPRSYVEQLRSESAAARVKAKEYEAKLKEFEDRDLSEVDRAKKEAEEATKEREQLRAELVSTKRESLVHRLASELNFNDPSDAIALLPPLEPGDDGLPSPKAVKGALETILKSKPYLATVQSPGGSDGGSRGSAPLPPTDEKAKQYQDDIEQKGGVRMPVL